MIIDSSEMYLYFFVICMGQRPYVIIKNIIMKDSFNVWVKKVDGEQLSDYML